MPSWHSICKDTQINQHIPLKINIIFPKNVFQHIFDDWWVCVLFRMLGFL